MLVKNFAVPRKLVPDPLNWRSRPTKPVLQTIPIFPLSFTLQDERGKSERTLESKFLAAKPCGIVRVVSSKRLALRGAGGWEIDAEIKITPRRKTKACPLLTDNAL